MLSSGGKEESGTERCVALPGVKFVPPALSGEGFFPKRSRETHRDTQCATVPGIFFKAWTLAVTEPERRKMKARQERELLMFLHYCA